MLFKSFYPRVILMLAVVNLALFALLAFINAFFFREAVVDLTGQLLRGRVESTFSALNDRFSDSAIPGQITSFLDSLYFEFNLSLYDRDGRLIAGVNSAFEHIPIDSTLKRNGRFTGFSKIYANPDPNSRFATIKVDIYPADEPIFNKGMLLFAFSGVMTIVVAGIVGWLLVAKLNERLERLKTGVSQMSAGLLEVQLDIQGEDEIAFLARKFNLMSKRIKKLIENLEESNASRQRLFAHASHEIKSPLTSIKGFIDIIDYMKVLPEDQKQRLLPAVKKDINRVIKITNDMLQISRLRDPEYQLDIKEVRIAELIREEHNHFARRAHERDATAALRCSIPGGMIMETDPDRLSQIWDNLWGNSLKYGDLTRPITTEVFQQEDEIGFRISNRLRSQLPVTTQQLFEPFYRSPADADRVPGSGLGLAIVKELVENLGGKITADVVQEDLHVTISLPQMAPEKTRAS